MSRTALILAAHGSRHEPAANEAICRMAKDLAPRLDFDEIVAAFHQGEPTFATVLDRIHADDVTVLPIMTSEGYYCDEFLPAQLRLNRRFSECRVVQSSPIGVHFEMALLVARRAEELAAQCGLAAATTTLAIVGHGTPRHPKSRAATEALVQSLRIRGRFAEVLAAYLDDAPPVEQIPSLVQSRDIIVIPFLISPGPHATRDLPRRLGIGDPDSPAPPLWSRMGRRRVICDRPIGADPRLLEMVANIAGESKRKRHRPAGRAPTFRLGTRASAMALWQADFVAARLRAYGVAVEIVPLSTLGDRVLDRSIADLPVDAPFAQDIEQALLDGRIDLAVHCLKDLAVQPTPGLQLAAILERDDVAEALVSCSGLALRDLPAGAIVGTCSPRRAAQLLAVRPDLRATNIRGPVEDRIRQVHAGQFDATILAVAGLRRLGLMREITEVLSLDDFLPAPGQGALAVQVRANDDEARTLCTPLDHEPTRRATTAELEFLRPFEGRRDALAAAYATAGRRIRLRARVISPDAATMREVSILGDDPIAVARQALEELGSRPRSPLTTHEIQGIGAAL
ncbi:MAG TPA: hydroxymethylbilane synthase [Phycisphaerae bacterium]|nr:hydroxymethylbilane synthase [Phycisphaerae bacterium]